MSIFTQRLELLMKEKKITFVNVSKDLKIGKNNLTYWKKKDNLPNGEILNKLADYFEVTVDYLLGVEKKSDDIEITGLDESKYKKELIDKINQLPEKYQKEMIEYAKYLLSRSNDD